MAVKVLVNAIGQHILADVKQVEDSETNEVLAYWLRDAKAVSYQPTPEGQVGIQLSDFCPIATGAEFSIRRDNIVAILDPREDVLATYDKLINPPTFTPEVVEDATESDSTEE
ncbi:hypothetical protein [Synechococcus phage S-N03]|uniref:Uncharacterized protein n=1 Tax=Synechococcus phage S-N03 TaxID=2718943 RepID=A0A6G8R5U3_9CAUD|nr:hypothetical protein PQC09_gp116 [Synechococcus phage S-N03]QIN96751.1 hypothetical protein [Synechococcus phage S-N03]